MTVRRRPTAPPVDGAVDWGVAGQCLAVTTTDLLGGASEILAANTMGTSITANYDDSGTGVLSLTGSDTVVQ